MTLEEMLKSPTPPEQNELSKEELVRFYWKYRGQLKKWERANAFWEATNQNLSHAYEKLDEKERQLEHAYNLIQEDLEVGSRIQQALLPSTLEQMEDELELAVSHHQLAEVGGDYYDFFRTSDERYAIGVFDISGHGVSAALVMTYLKAQFMQTMEVLDQPKAIVERVNAISFRFLRSVKKYATVNFVKFEEDQLRYVCGGGFGYLLRQGEEHHFYKRDHFLGLRNKPFKEQTLPFASGDILALYTDGMIEGQNAERQDYTVKRLNSLIKDHRDKKVAEILDLCVKDYEQFREKDTDDITLLLLRKK